MDNTKDELLQRRSKLSPTQRSLLEKRLRGEVDSHSQLEVIHRRYQKSPAPLSYAQQRLWFLHQLDPDNPHYSELACVQLTGALNVDALEKSLNEIVQRHEALRTTFELVEEQAVQVIHSTVTVELAVVNLRWIPEVEQQAQIEQITTEIAQKPFDLATAPLLRAMLLQIGEQEYLLLFTIHHIVVDGWSIGVLIRELALLYEAFSTGKTSPLPDLPIQYADFAIWQRQWLQGQLQKTQLDYWKQQLAGAATLALPTDRPRPPIQSFQGAVTSFELSASLTDMLRDLSNQEGVTLFMTILAAFQALLYRYTGQEDICVGSPIANRNQSEIQGLIGFFVNTLVLRTDLAGNPSFLELLNRVREVCVGAYAHADLPFEQLVAELQPDRNLSYMPLFQVMFAWQEDTEKELTLPGLTLNWLPTVTQTSKFDLTLHVVDAKPELKGFLEYNTDLFDAETVSRMLAHLRTLLEGIVANPQARLFDLPILTTNELNQQLLEWNNTKVEYPQQQCIHQLFETQVEKTPDAVAVVFEDEQLTYGELNARANQLAHYLQKLGVKPEVLVGICVERSLAMVIGLLAILKAGGAYVPLDPSYPPERLAYMLQDAQIPVLLTQQHLRDNLPQHQTRVVYLDTDWQSIAQENSQNLVSACTSNNLAYVIYTSGSTGQPKGVLVNHSNVARLLAATESWYKFNEQDVWTLFHSIAFDFSVWEIWGALVSGGKLVVVPYWLSRSPEDFYKLLLTQQVTVLNQTPSAFSQLIQAEESLGTGNKLSLRKVIFGGEALQLESLRPWLERHGDAFPQLVNMYGITETTVHLTYRPLSMVDLETVSASVIGRPIGDVQIYLLDKYGQPVPIGVPGEMYIGGAGVTRGYLNRPELTSQKFIPNPFRNKPDARLYKSGDLARYLPSGELEYIGRIDDQVKIRGFRIELGEIEALITQYPAVRETVVVVRSDLADSQQIVAYVVPHTKEILSISELRSFLESKLPNYMVPTAFVTLSALPLTPNGKINRKALPAPELTQLSSSDYVPPTTPIENLLVEIWAEILKLDKVGIHDNFFELGGHSLIATRVISQIRQVFQRELPLRCLFEKPTIAGLATEIEITNKAGLGTQTTKIEPIERSPQLPLSFAQQRLWFLTQLEPDSPFYNIPAAVRLQGELNFNALQQTFNEILHRHETLRTNFQTIEGQAITVIQEATPLVLSLLDLSQLPLDQQELEVKQQAAQEAQQPFDINSDHLLRVKLLRLNAQEHIVLLTMHHIASDGWSIGVLVQELATLYSAFCHGQAISCGDATRSLLPQRGTPLAELPIQYVDFAAWQRQWLQGEVLQSQISYWRSQLENAPRVLELPTDYPRPAIQTFQGATYSFNISPQLSLALSKLSQQQGSTLFMTLLAAFQTLLWRYTGQEDIVVGSPIANRNRGEIEGLIGFFVNTLVLRTNLAGNPRFEELLKRVREVALGAYAHQDLPFELLVEQLQPQRDLSYTPLFQVMFVLQNAPMSALELPGLTLSPVESESNISKFDLTLYMSETESGIVGNLEYNTDLFQEASIHRMVEHLQTLLSGIVVDPQQRLSQLPLLSEPEKYQLLQEWNDTRVDYPQHQCIHELFEAQVQKTPDAIAIVFEDEQLTYRELNARANQLAHYLRSLGVKSEVLVGICVERSLDMLIGLLAILKVGGAYIPLDPNYPQERLAFILEDAQVSVLLTQASLLTKIPQHQAQTICLDTDGQLISPQSPENLSSQLTPENLAYIIYTSGSTGKPKGVQIPHKALNNFLFAMQQSPGITQEDTLIAVTTYSFDIAALELFLPIIVGARLVIVSREIAADGIQLSAKLTDSQATLMQATPATWQLLLAAGWGGNQQLKILCGGEALPAHLANQLLERCASLWNMYGPTETTIWSAASQIKTVDGTVKISQPIANTQLYILDKYSQLVPVGVTGELHIGGDGLAQGYFHRPDLTAEKFIPNPFSKKAARLYKTGDLARYLPNGEIEYLGRIDYQVKLRGFRIELGEIEAVLSQHPTIRETVVTVREDATNSQRLVAYVVPQQEQTLIIPELRNFLESKLPNYMVPATFVKLETLPLTPNGKVDRKALPVPDTVRPELEKAFIAPQTIVEKQLAIIWRQVLGLAELGINDNFFELGGDSILSLQVISKANQAGLHLTPKQLFQHQTIAQLAAVAGTSEKILAEQNLVTGSLALTPIQHWFFEQEQPEPHHWNQAVMLEVKQRLDQVVLEKVLQILQKHHDALRSRFIKEEFGFQAVITGDHPVTSTYLDLSALPPEKQVAQMEAMSIQLQASLNLTEGPLFRVALFDLGTNQPSRLLWVIHHLIIDGVSWRILIEDFQTAHQQICQNKAIQLPPKTTSVKQWSSYLQKYSQLPALLSELEYWLTIEQQIVKPIPLDFRYENNLEASACTLTVSLTEEETQVLLQQVPAVYQTQINDVLLTALVQTFSQWTGETSLLIDLEGHGREELFEDVDLSRTVGWFTTIFPVHLSCENTFDSPGKVLKSIKEQLRAIPNRGIGYGVWRYLCGDQEIRERFSRLPKAEVVFNYLGQFDQVLAESSLLSFAQESIGPHHSLQSRRTYLLEINAGISQGHLQMNWNYSNQLHRRSTVETLAQNFIAALRSLITHCQTADAGGFTPSDFAEFNQSQWDQTDLDAITAAIGDI